MTATSARGAAGLRRAPTASGARSGVHAGGFAITAKRLLAAVTLLASAAAFYGATSSSAFELERLDVSGASQAAPPDVRHAVETVIGERPNLFRVRSADIAEAVSALPAVRAAHVTVALPDRLVVGVIERVPILTWRTESAAFLVDAEGRLFLTAPLDDPRPDLPVVRDSREFATAFELGSWLEPADLAAVRQLGALTPRDLGSKATSLQLTVDDTQGWTLAAAPRSWRAVFGFYTSRSRRAELIPAQVQCLRALLGTGETKIDRIFLGRPGERCGTYTSRPVR
jgi:cell division septal protein FtsQ